MNVRLLALASTIVMVAACTNDTATPGTLPPLIGAAGGVPTSTVAPTTTIVDITTTTAVAVATVAPTTVPAVVATAAATTADPHGAAIETGCVRSNIDFAALREAPGVDQSQVGEIAPGTCDVLVYAIGSDGRIPWLQVAFGDVFGWSAESNFVQSSFGPAP